MERKSVVAFTVLLGLTGLAWAAQDKKEGGGGPYGLPAFADVKEKIKLTDDEAKKVEEIYTAAAKNEQESKSRAKENGTDNKTLQGYLQIGRNETVNKVKEALDKEKAAAYDKLCLAGQPSKKKK
jgi:hypothetical protein